MSEPDKEIIEETTELPKPTPPSSDAVNFVPTLKKILAYWHPYKTFAKQRWWNREILELVSTEFRDRSIEYYRFALESGVTTVNGKIAKPGTIVRNGDRIENVVHRHEPPVTSVPVKIIHRDDAAEIIVIDKPGSIPVHVTGRYFKNSIVEILQNDFGFPKVYTVNRLDRLTSGCMIIALSSNRAKLLCQEFIKGTVQKEYIARCCGRFPEEEVTVDQPMLTVDRQMGLNIVHPEGKHAKTTFRRLFYDRLSDTSVLHCRPWTGRSHQIRVHLQYIGYPIANDPVYNDLRAWGPNRGKGGLALVSSADRPAPPPIYYPKTDGKSSPPPPSDPSAERTLLPRENGTDIGLSSPVPLSAEAVSVISKLREMKDENEDYSRWRDVIFRAKKALQPTGLTTGDLASMGLAPTSDTTNPALEIVPVSDEDEPVVQVSDVSQLAAELPPGPGLYCPECYLPLLPDPRPEQLFIFLHAWKYTTSEWSFETEMPFWAVEGYKWVQPSHTETKVAPVGIA